MWRSCPSYSGTAASCFGSRFRQDARRYIMSTSIKIPCHTIAKTSQLACSALNVIPGDNRLGPFFAIEGSDADSARLLLAGLPAAVAQWRMKAYLADSSHLMDACRLAWQVGSSPYNSISIDYGSFLVEFFPTQTFVNTEGSRKDKRSLPGVR